MGECEMHGLVGVFAVDLQITKRYRFTIRSQIP
jgi:hypothetical protein